MTHPVGAEYIGDVVGSAIAVQKAQKRVTLRVRRLDACCPSRLAVAGPDSGPPTNASRAPGGSNPKSTSTLGPP